MTLGVKPRSMATFPDLDTIEPFAATAADANTLTLPIRGREYTWKSTDLTLRAGLQLQRLDRQARATVDKAARGEDVDDTEVALTTAEEKRLADDLIGTENLARMAADGVKWRELKHVLGVLMAWHLRGEAVARMVWERRPKA